MIDHPGGRGGGTGGDRSICKWQSGQEALRNRRFQGQDGPIRPGITGDRDRTERQRCGRTRAEHPPEGAFRDIKGGKSAQRRPETNGDRHLAQPTKFLTDRSSSTTATIDQYL